MSNDTATRPDWIHCIELAHGTSWCGQRITGFYFPGLDHAAQSATVGSRIVACQHCVRAAMKAMLPDASTCTKSQVPIVEVPDDCHVVMWRGSAFNLERIKEALTPWPPMPPQG